MAKRVSVAPAFPLSSEDDPATARSYDPDAAQAELEQAATVTLTNALRRLAEAAEPEEIERAKAAVADARRALKQIAIFGPGA